MPKQINPPPHLHSEIHKRKQAEAAALREQIVANAKHAKGKMRCVGCVAWVPVVGS